MTRQSRLMFGIELQRNRHTNEHIIDGSETSVSTSFLIFIFHPITGKGWCSFSSHLSICLRLASSLRWLIALCSCAPKSFFEVTWFKVKEMLPSPLSTKEKSRSMLSLALSHRHYFCFSFSIAIIRKGIISAKSCWLFGELLEAKWQGICNK